MPASSKFSLSGAVHGFSLTAIRSACRIIPGILTAFAIACAAVLMSYWFVGSNWASLILALAFGGIVRNVVGVYPSLESGISFCSKTLLRLAVVLLGLQVTLIEVLEIGASGLAVVLVSFLATYFFTIKVSGLLGVERPVAELIAAGTSVCGASAILATRTVNQAPDEDATYAILCVTLIGSILMIILPLLIDRTGLNSHSYGIWVGASLHEVAQVVGAGFQIDETAGETSVIAKLARVCLLAPLLILVGSQARPSAPVGSARPSPRIPIPWFVGGFLLLVAMNNYVVLGPGLKAGAHALFTALLISAMAALGLQSDFMKLMVRGARPLLLSVLASLFILSSSFALVKWLL